MLIDLVFVVLMISAAIKGFSRGLIMAVFSFLAFFIGLAAALKLSAVVANHLQDFTQQPSRWWPFIAFLLVMLIVGSIVRVIGRLLEKTMEFALMGWVNKLGGFLVFAVLHTLLLSVALFYLAKMHLLPADTAKSSLVLPWIEPWGPWTIDLMSRLLPSFKNVFADLQSFFDGVEKKIGA
jgi:membrane protein required for colicin V production